MSTTGTSTREHETAELLEVVTTAMRALGSARRRLEERQRAEGGQLTLPVDLPEPKTGD